MAKCLRCQAGAEWIQGRIPTDAKGTNLIAAARSILKDARTDYTALAASDDWQRYKRLLKRIDKWLADSARGSAE